MRRILLSVLVWVTSGQMPIAENLRLWYRQPAKQWVEALPVGNGRLGAMVFGGVTSERLQLNEDTLWSGGPKNWHNVACRLDGPVGGHEPLARGCPPARLSR